MVSVWKVVEVEDFVSGLDGGGNTYTAGTGLNLSGTQFYLDIDTLATGTIASGDEIAFDDGGTTKRATIQSSVLAGLPSITNNTNKYLKATSTGLAWDTPSGSGGSGWDDWDDVDSPTGETFLGSSLHVNLDYLAVYDSSASSWGYTNPFWMTNKGMIAYAASTYNETTVDDANDKIWFYDNSASSIRNINIDDLP